MKVAIQTIIIMITTPQLQIMTPHAIMGMKDQLKNDSLESTHLKNDYNDAADRFLSFESQSPTTIIQDMATVHTAPSNISDACNNCKD